MRSGRRKKIEDNLAFETTPLGNVIVDLSKVRLKTKKDVRDTSEVIQSVLKEKS